MFAEEYRLTEADEDRMRAAIRRVWHQYETEGGPRERGIEDEAMRRLAAHSIGCSLYDLRPVELQWVDSEIGEVRLGLDA